MKLRFEICYPFKVFFFLNKQVKLRNKNLK